MAFTVFLAYDKFASDDKSTNAPNDNTTSAKVLDKFVGKYVSSEYDESKLGELDKIIF